MGKSANEDVAVERELTVKLTDQELLERGEAMADCELEIDKRKAARKVVNAEIRTETDERARLAHIIESGIESRKVLCKWVADYRKNVWSLVRQDTREEVDTRPMTAADRQAGLDFEDVVIAPPRPTTTNGTGKKKAAKRKGTTTKKRATQPAA